MYICQNLACMSFFKHYLPYYKRNLSIAIPVMLSQMGQILVQQIDNMMVGHVGTTELAAASFANSVFIIGMVMGMGFTFGLTPLIGQAYTQGHHLKSASLLKNSAFLDVIIALTLGLILYVISFFMNRMGQPPQVVKLAVSYYRILVISFLPLMVFYLLKQFSEGLGNTKIAMYVTISANIVNIILNYIFIYGKLGFPALGLNGAGYATLSARILMPLIFIVIFSKNIQMKKYLVLITHTRINWVELKKLFHVSMPISLQMLLEVSAFALSSVMMGWFGEVPLAAHQIALGLATVTFMIVSGIASGTTIRVAHQYGKKDYYGMYKAAMASIHLVLAFMLLSAISFVVFRGYLPYLYSNNEEVIALTTQLLLLAAIFQIFDGLQVVSLGILRGLADVKRPMIYAFIAYIIVNLPLGYFLSFTLKVGPLGIWIGFVVGLICASLLFSTRFRKIYKGLL